MGDTGQLSPPLTDAAQRYAVRWQTGGAFRPGELVAGQGQALPGDSAPGRLRCNLRRSRAQCDVGNAPKPFQVSCVGMGATGRHAQCDRILHRT